MSSHEGELVGEQPSLPPLPSEQILIEAMPDFGAQRAIVVSPGRAQTADLLVSRGLEKVAAWTFDLHAASEIARFCDAQVEVQCGTDLPDGEIDLFVMPVMRRGEAELTREMLQQGHERLVDGGHMVVSVDNPGDTWLHEQLQAMFDKVTCHRHDRGSVYWARRSKPLKKLRDFSCQFAFRDEDERLIKIISRPGVFSHRRLDPGARQLMLTAEIGPEDNVLEVGCGSGAVSLAAAFQTNGTIVAMDANTRAVDCTQQGAELNGLSNVECVLNADGGLDLSIPIDIALANPPYFGNNAISKHFVDTAVSALRRGGALLVVTKQPAWYEEYFQDKLEDIEVFESSRYHIACGRKP